MREKNIIHNRVLFPCWFFVEYIAISSAPGSAKGHRKPSSQRPPLRPAARSGISPRLSRKNMGTNTMQMHRVETSARSRFPAEPSRIVLTVSLPCARFLSTTPRSQLWRHPQGCPRQAPATPSVIRLIVSCSILSMAMEIRIESGMESAMITVLRQLPRKRRIINAVKQAATRPSRITPWTAALTKIDWSNRGVIWI